MSDARPTVALAVTTYFSGSHADVAGTRLIRGYEWLGRFVEPRVRVASMYVEQLGDHQGKAPRPDIGHRLAEDAGIEVYPTIGEAIGCGRAGVNVDGVVIIGEHGDYEDNEFGQQVYPRRRMFDTAVGAMVTAGRVVPVAMDKHLSYSFTDARAMFDTARRLGIAMVAGSSVPLAWRVPTGAVWPAGAPMTQAVCVGWGPAERYGFHILELLQSQVERRAGAETGVAEVQALQGADAQAAVSSGAVNADLLDQALAAIQLDGDQRDAARGSVVELFLVTYRDGTTAAAVNCAQQVRSFGFAADGPRDRVAFGSWLQRRPHGHFRYLVRQIESLVLAGREPYPVDRTLLTTGILDRAMRSRHAGGSAFATPELEVSYQPVFDVPDTAAVLPKPPGQMNAEAAPIDPHRSSVEEPPDDDGQSHQMIG